MLPQYSPRRFDHRKSVGPATRAKQRRFRRDVCLITLLILLLTWWVIKYGFVANDDATVVQIQQSPNSQSSNDDKDKTSATEKTTDFSKNIPVTTGKNQGNEKSSSSTSSKTDNKNSGEDNSHSPLSSSSSTTSNPQETRESNLKKLIFSEIKNYLVLDAALDPSLIDKVQLQLAHVIFHNGKFWSAMDANDAATTKEGYYLLKHKL